MSARPCRPGRAVLGAVPRPAERKRAGISHDQSRSVTRPHRGADSAERRGCSGRTQESGSFLRRIPAVPARPPAGTVAVPGWPGAARDLERPDPAAAPPIPPRSPNPSLLQWSRCGAGIDRTRRRFRFEIPHRSATVDTRPAGVAPQHRVGPRPGPVSPLARAPCAHQLARMTHGLFSLRVFQIKRCSANHCLCIVCRSRPLPPPRAGPAAQGRPQ